MGECVLMNNEKNYACANDMNAKCAYNTLKIFVISDLKWEPDPKIDESAICISKKL